MTDKFCCEEWAEAVGTHQAFSGGGVGLYPPSMQPDGQIEKVNDGTWAINGCCGGGCFVVTGVKFCPFCGAKVQTFACEEAQAVSEGGEDE